MMSASVKPTIVHTIEEKHEMSPLLDDIVSRMSVIEAKQSRPAPVQLRTWEDIERFAEKAARSGMVPKDFIGKPDAICIAVQMGSELGLAPMQSLQNIAVVNGRPSIWGDALPGLCRASGMCRSIREWSDGEGDDLTYHCEAVRKDQAQPITGKFSVADAKRAKLWQENPTTQKRSREGGTYTADSGPWYSYAARMLQMRARGFALRDAFPDVLKGLITAEEARDTPVDDMPASAPQLSSRLPTHTMDQKIGDSLPDHSTAPKRKTWAELLVEIEETFRTSYTREEVDQTLASDQVQKALDSARNGTKEKLDALIKAAMDRTDQPDDGSAMTDSPSDAA